MHCFFFFISTHTLTWSVTGAISAGLTGVKDFNSHAHVERDINIISAKDYTRISTHTLTWSVTHGRTNFISFFWYFNSHAHVERDN